MSQTKKHTTAGKKPATANPLPRSKKAAGGQRDAKPDKPAELKAAFVNLFKTLLIGGAEERKALSDDKRAGLIADCNSLLERWTLYQTNEGVTEERTRLGTARDAMSKLSPDTFTQQCFKLLAGYALRLEIECDALRGKLEGGYWGFCPEDRRRSRLAPPPPAPLKPKGRKPLTPKETSAERRKLSKRSHDHLRARRLRPGSIEIALAPSGYPLPPDFEERWLLSPLDPLLSGHLVTQADLCELFGRSRKHFPPIPKSEKHKCGRKVSFDSRAFFRIADHLLTRGTWLADESSRSKFFKALMSKLRSRTCPAGVDAAIHDFLLERA